MLVKSYYKSSYGLLPDSVKQAKKMVYGEILDYGDLDLGEIKVIDFPSSQYYRNHTDKNQIVLHHTVSGNDANGDILWWKMTKERISTHVIIDRSGLINQLYSSKYWSHHLGVKSSFLKKMGFDDWKYRNVLLNKQSIGIEIDSWGALLKYDGKYYPIKLNKEQTKYIPNTSQKPIPKKNVFTYKDGFRGFNYYERYTNEQIKKLAQLLKYWKDVYNINIKYNSSMWDVSREALSGKTGVWAHVSYRPDKSDVHPQPSLIKMLQSL